MRLLAASISCGLDTILKTFLGVHCFENGSPHIHLWLSFMINQMFTNSLHLERELCEFGMNLAKGIQPRVSSDYKAGHYKCSIITKQTVVCRGVKVPPKGLGKLFLEKPPLFLRHCQPYSHTSWSPDKSPQALHCLGDATLDRTSKKKKCTLPTHLKSSSLIIIIPESHGCCFPCPGVTKPRPQHGHLGQLHKEHTVGRSP